MHSIIGGWQRMGGTNLLLGASATTFPSYTATEPAASATRAVVAVPKRANGLCPTNADFAGFGAGADGANFRGTMVRWNRAGSGLWLPTPVWRLGFTLSTFVGNSNLTDYLLATTDRVADTIDSTTSGFFKDDGTLILSPADNTPANVRFDIGGAEYLELVGDLNSSATSFNGLVKFLD